MKIGNWVYRQILISNLDINIIENKTSKLIMVLIIRSLKVMVIMTIMMKLMK